MKAPPISFIMLSISMFSVSSHQSEWLPPLWTIYNRILRIPEINPPKGGFFRMPVLL